jgi:hypothetical protein
MPTAAGRDRESWKVARAGFTPSKESFNRAGLIEAVKGY